MTLSFTWAALLVAVTLSLCQGQSQDATLLQEARGTAVVDAVVEMIRSKCVFSDDRLFLRRLATVASNNGNSIHTYPANFHGGIWQVNQSMFSSTLDCANPYIAPSCNTISSQLGIDWITVQWVDLRKPLYSGLAASLYALLTLTNNTMPGDVASQADLWAAMYGKPSQEFITAAGRPETFDCSNMDLAFILDSSGSVSATDFQLMKVFTANVVNEMTISPEKVRVADIVYASSVSVHFKFDDNMNNSQVQEDLMNTVKLGGRTYTNLALDQAAITLYDTAGSGARQNAKKVAVLITDGYSRSFNNTKVSAEALRQLGTTIFAIGVGGYRLEELRAVASEPVCSHVLTLSDFGDIHSIVTEIQRSTCDAPIRLTKTNELNKNISQQNQINDVDIVTDIQDGNDTIEAEVTCGILNIYMSTSFSKPSSAVHEHYFHVTSGTVQLTNNIQLTAGSSVFIKVVASRLPLVATGNAACPSYHWALRIVPMKDVRVICEDNGIQRSCTQNDIVNAGLCPDKVTYPFENPCTAENLAKGLLKHAYPYDATKFITCDLQGHFYVEACSGGVIFNGQTGQCGFTAPATAVPGTGGNLPASVPNPCTAQALMANIFYHEFADDKTMFIQCDQWGNAWLMPCGPATEWSQAAYTCVHAKPAFPNVCALSDGIVANPCEHTSYYSCVHGNPIKMPCPGGLVFSPVNKTCIFGSGNGAPWPAYCP